MIKTVEMDLSFMPYIQGPPQTPKKLYDQACSNDEITVQTWKKIWIDQTKKNHKINGPFSEKSVSKLFNQLLLKPCIVVGSGPSLKTNVDELKNTRGIPVISCLHNYQFLEDRGITPDYYVTLDSGYVAVEEVSEGGTKTPEEYFASTKGKKLCAFIGTHPDLIEKWQGEILWFNAPIPDAEVTKEMDAVENFGNYISSGGNVLGACFYIAKAILGANPIIFVGADFSFSYTNKFHGWDSKYDENMGSVMNAVDIFGNRVKTWGSYYNFKCWFESRVCTIPGLYINSTEGGIFGAYPGGNIEQLRQIALADVIKMYTLTDYVKDVFEVNSTEKKVLF